MLECHVGHPTIVGFEALTAVVTERAVAMNSTEIQHMLQRNISPPSSGSKNKKHEADSKLATCKKPK
jgi:hypothetical protein